MPPDVDILRIGNPAIAWSRFGEPSPTPVVFLHGLGDSAIISHEPIARALAHQAIGSLLIDFPGFGYSTAPTGWPATIEAHASAVAAALDNLGVQEATIVAHSMGGSTALVLASMIPERISRLILAEPLLVREHSELAKAIAKRGEDDFVSRGYGMLLRATRRQAARGDRAAQAFLVPLQRADPAILHRSAVSLLADRSPSFLSRLRSIQHPRTLLVGERTTMDRAILPRDVRAIIIPRAGHSMMTENPEAVSQVIAMCVAQGATRDQA